MGGSCKMQLFVLENGRLGEDSVFDAGRNCIIFFDVIYMAS